MSGTAHACEDFSEAVDWALQNLMEIKTAEARTALDAAEDALACNPSLGPETLARFFIVDGAAAVFEGDPDSAALSFVAAHRLDANVWLDVLGPKIRQEYDAAQDRFDPVSDLTVQAAPGWTVWLDGGVLNGRAQVHAGLHVVQIVAGEWTSYGRVVYINPGQNETLVPDLPVVPDTPTPPATDPSERDAIARTTPRPSRPSSEPPAARPWALTLDGAVSANLGQALEATLADGTQLAEPANKLTIPVQAGVRFRTGSWWMHPRLGVAPLVGGQFLFGTQDGARGVPYALLLSAAAGAQVGQIDVGGQLVMTDPSRLGARMVGGTGLGQTPLTAELRAGLDLGTANRWEPAAALALGFEWP